MHDLIIAGYLGLQIKFNCNFKQVFVELFAFHEPYKT